jgi:exodeoxyribonuclease VII large subunit
MEGPISLLVLNQLIKNTLENYLDASYWVIAEIGEIKQGTGGHAYLDLVEKQGSQLSAKLRANIWSYSYRTIASRFNSVTGQNLRQGMKILAYATVTYHELYGISLNIKDIDPNYTLGERARQRQEILEKLKSEGLTELNKGLPLPTVPQRIAVISSATAAGYGDFINQLQNNVFGYSIFTTLYQANLQGAGGASSLLQALEQVILKKEKYDAIVIIRGGGAQTDLDCFDDYDLCAGIAKSPLPVFTGIGHEKDETIADLVAHTKLKTPTAVAEFLLSGMRSFEENLLEKLNFMERHAAQKLSQASKMLSDQENRLKSISKNEIQMAHEKFRFLQAGILNHVNTRQKIAKLKINSLEIQLLSQSKGLITRSFQKVEHLERSVTQLDPKKMLQRGYTRTESEGKPIDFVELIVGQQLTTYTNTKKIQSSITKIENNE